MKNTPTAPLLDFHNISVMRGQKIALSDFNLRIGADEHVAILGPNGCGKSTLIKTITRECYPLAGENSSMSILGQDSWDVFSLRSLLGIVSNDLMLLKTVQEVEAQSLCVGQPPLASSDRSTAPENRQRHAAERSDGPERAGELRDGNYSRDA